MENVMVTDDIKYIGVNDKTLDLFESQYTLSNGMAYNSYLIIDEKVVLMDTVDKRVTKQWLSNLMENLGDRKIDYLVISHLEPDHSYNIEKVIDMFPDMKVVLNAVSFKMFSQFFDEDINDKKIIVKDGETLNIGKHTLQFFTASMVHWPEVMVTYDMKDKVLFSADAFGKFGIVDDKKDWLKEARRYYFNIVGKYGVQVQALLKKLSTLNVDIICPLHGPVLKENISYYVDKYDIWSKYMYEENGILIAYNSIHFNTKNAIEKLVKILDSYGEKNVVVKDLAREDISEVVEEAFLYDKLIVASPTYEMGLFPFMKNFLEHLESKNYQKRKVGIIENGSWAPMAAKLMKESFSKMKDIQIVEPVITIKTKLSEKNLDDMENLVKNMLK